MKKKTLLVLLAAIFALSACIPSQQQVDEIFNSVEQTALAQVTVVAAPTQDVNAIVQATFQALTAQAMTPAPAGQVAVTGSISGQVLPDAHHVGAFQIGSDAFYKFDLQAGQTSYQLDNLPPGSYYVLGFSDPAGFAAPFPFAFSQYVICGLGPDYTDHGLVPVSVEAGQLTANINILDNYGAQDRNPYMIKYFGYDVTNTGTDNIPTNTPPGGQTGSISGTLSYPAEGLPAMAIVAFHVGGAPTDYYYTTTQQGQSTYQMANLPPANYWVVAYSLGGGGFPAGLAGGYTQFVVCGMQPACSDHDLVQVAVNGGQVTPNINPQDWYAPQGTFPDNPLP